MKLERIVLESISTSAPLSPEKIAKGEKHILTSNAVDFESEKRKKDNPEDSGSNKEEHSDSEAEILKGNGNSREDQLGKRLDILV